MIIRFLQSILLAAVLLLPAAPVHTQAAGLNALPAGFSDESVVSGLLAPRAFVFTPDGRILIAETGSEASTDINFASIRVYKNGALLPARALTLDVCGDGERGLLGLALDPAFAQNGYVYVYYSRQGPADALCAYNTYTTGLPGPRNRVSRFTLSGDTIDPASEKVLLDNIPSDAGIHNAGDLNFGADGYLYVSTGNGGIDAAMPPGSAPMPQDPARLGGKILRILPVNNDPRGYVTDGNPFDVASGAWYCGPLGSAPGSSANPCREVYATGFRNPFRFTVQPGTSQLFVGDVGGGVWEEIDEVVAGGNYGHPTREGPCQNGIACTPPYVPEPGLFDPIFAYQHASIGANVDSAVIMGAFYTGLSYPVEYHDNLFYADFARGFIRRLAHDPMTETWNPVGGDFATGLTGIIGLKSGLNGDLYYLILGGTPDVPDHRLRRIRYQPGLNQAPVAVISANPRGGPLNTVFSFSAAGSYDPDGNLPLVYTWNFGDGTSVSGADKAAVTHTYASSGTYTVSLMVSDGAVPAGVSTPSTLKVYPGNLPPSAQIVLANLSEPARTGGYYAGDTWSFSAVNYVDDQPKPADPYRWEVVFHHELHAHPFLSNLAGASGQFSLPTLWETSTNVWFRVRLHITDSAGLESVVEADIHPTLSTLTVASAPAGVFILLDGVPRATPFSVQRVVGLQTTLQAPLNPVVGDIPFTFTGWGALPAAVQTLSIPVQPATWTAHYQAPHTVRLPVISR